MLDVRLAEESAWRRWYLRNERLVLGLAGFFSVLVVWELAVQLGHLNPIFMSSPSGILEAGDQEVRQGRIWGDVGTSLLEFALGYLCAGVVGIIVGVVAGWYRRANYVADPWLAALYATPDAALVPLIILWLGIDIWSKVFIVFLSALFPVAINTLVGVQSTEARFLDVARSFSADQRTVFTTVVLPGSVPFIATGLRLAAGRALVAVVFAELVAANQGIGFMISVAGATLQTGRLMLGVVLLGTLGVLLGQVMRRVEQRFEVWRPQSADT